MGEVFAKRGTPAEKRRLLLDGRAAQDTLGRTAAPLPALGGAEGFRAAPRAPAPGWLGVLAVLVRDTPPPSPASGVLFGAAPSFALLALSFRDFGERYSVFSVASEHS